MKRETVHIFDGGQFPEAWSLARFFRSRGVDAVLVTRHAVQVRPDHARQAAAAVPDWKWGWDRQEGKRNGYAEERANAMLRERL